MKKNTKKVIRNVAIGTGIVAAVGAAAYAVKDNPKVKKVAHAMKKEIVSEAKKVKVASKAAYEKVAKEIVSKYKQATHSDIWELINMGNEIKDAWDQVKGFAAEVTKQPKKQVKKTVTKTNKTKKIKKA
jgi:hypothetical protein